MSDNTVRGHADDVTFYLHTEDGRTLTVQDPPQVKPRAMIRSLVEAREIPGVDHQGRPIQWCLDDREARKTLDDARTLQENGVRSGHHLYLRRSPKTIRLHIQSKARTASKEIAPTATTEQLIEEVLREFRLQLVDSKGRTIEWVVNDKDTATTLTPGKTLEEQGVLDGHHLWVRQKSRQLILALILAGVGLAIVVALAIWFWARFEIPIEVRTPAGARVQIDGRDSPLKTRLRKGNHQIEVSKTGYQSVSLSVEVKVGLAPIEVELTRLPLPDLWLSTNLTGITAQLDATPLTQAFEGLAFEQIPEGDHTVSFRTADAQMVKFGLKSTRGAVPEITNPTVPQSLVVAFVTSRSGQAQVRYSTPRQIQPSVQLDANPAVPLRADGLNLTLSAGTAHTLMFSVGSQQWTVPVETGSNPALAVFIASPTPNSTAETQTPENTTSGNPVTTGTLIVVTGLDGVQVFVNNANRGSTTHGRLILSGLATGSYTVRVAKHGYVSPAPKQAQLSARANSRLPFTLIPAVASLRLQNVIPGSRVFLDGNRVGVADGTGIFEKSPVSATSHPIRLEHDDYQPWQTTQAFTAGQNAIVVANQQRLWLVVVDTAPPTTNITYRRAGDAQDHVVNAGPVWLAAGSYTFTAYWNDIRCSKPAVVAPTPNEVAVTLVFHPNCR